ncbi:hypothetical protein K438DRAFT_1819891 [Mycena galopus ATCC 62051]|nr:hypothetical protein K438DRAFT_1887607 [Mycena galopus ATCC 62051]KAF8204443.1 hypothetical protein K438DRAFT_1819891 [Mycena galopus ATCC 62051]
MSSRAATWWTCCSPGCPLKLRPYTPTLREMKSPRLHFIAAVPRFFSDSSWLPRPGLATLGP